MRMPSPAVAGTGKASVWGLNTKIFFGDTGVG